MQVFLHFGMYHKCIIQQVDLFLLRRASYEELAKGAEGRRRGTPWRIREYVIERNARDAIDID